MKPRIGIRAAREALPAKEKEAIRLRDEPAREWRALPRAPVEEDCAFEGEGGEGSVHYAYSTHRRGLDAFNGAYQILDLVPKGRGEARLEWPRQRARRHDEYGGTEDGGHCR